MKTKDGEFNTLTITAARTGWIITEAGRPPEVFVRWEAVISYLTSRLTTNDQQSNGLSKEFRSMNNDELESPDWKNADRVHDWRNYISEELKEIWFTFDKRQKRIIAENAQKIADREEWD